MRVRGGWKGQAALVLRALTGDLVSGNFSDVDTKCWEKKGDEINDTTFSPHSGCGLWGDAGWWEYLPRSARLSFIWKVTIWTLTSLRAQSWWCHPRDRDQELSFYCGQRRKWGCCEGSREGGGRCHAIHSQAPDLCICPHPRWQSWSQHYLASLPRPSVHICRENICGAELGVLGAGWDHQEVMGSEDWLSNCYETARLNSQLQSLLSNDPGGGNETTTAWL